MDVKTIFPTRPIGFKQEVSELQKTSADREPPQGGFYSPYRENKEKYVSKQYFEANKREEVDRTMNEKELSVSNLLESIKLQRSLNEKIK